MTGEMAWIKPNGDAADGNSYPMHAAVAMDLGAALKPFDTYIGPYIDHAQGKIFITSDDGFRGAVCLWPGGEAPAYRQPLVEEFCPFDNLSAALEAARLVLKRSQP